MLDDFPCSRWTLSGETSFLYASHPLKLNPQILPSLFEIPPSAIRSRAANSGSVPSRTEILAANF